MQRFTTNVHRGRDLGTANPKWDVSITHCPPLPLGAQGAMQKRRWKNYESQREWRAPRKQGLINTTGLSHI